MNHMYFDGVLRGEPSVATGVAPRLLVVEDDNAVAEAVERGLRLGGYDPILCRTGLAAIEATERREVVAVILDLGLPDYDGLTVCREMRRRGDHTPVLMLTARDAIVDRVTGLDAGADDYLVKPFALDELLARVRSLLRRAGQHDAGTVLCFGDVRMELDTMIATRGARELSLTRTEWHLLELFLNNPKRVLTRSAIFTAVWGYDFGASSNALDVYVGYLRRKLECEGESRLIHTVRGFGYVLR